MLLELAQSTPSGEASRLKNLDYSVVQQCMHCGLCLPTCPTYEATKLERHSPRGRIAWMRSIVDGELTAGREFADEMYFCLGCLACATACPAGVDYAQLFENARAEAEESGALNAPWRRFLRFVTLKWLFMESSRLQMLGLVLRLYQRSGMQWFLRHCGILTLLPKRLRELEAMTPAIQPHFSEELIAPRTLPPAGMPARWRVALLTGCAQDLVFSDVNLDTLEALRQNGCEVITPAHQPCCGSLHAHNGEWEAAKDLARRQIDLFPPESFDAIITNAAGCGSHLKHYAALLQESPRYRAKAKKWDRKVKDIHEWLVEINFRPPRNPAYPPQHTAYHEACHLCHGQKITAQPRQILKAIPGLNLVELAESDWCCGSAGIYNILQPKMANALLERKLAHIESSGAEIVATGNPGCLLHLQNGARQQGKNLRLAHPVSLLAEAYRSESPQGGQKNTQWHARLDSNQ